MFYKILTPEMYSKNNMKWELNTPKRKPVVAAPELCSGTVVHAYKHPLAAQLLNNNYYGPQTFRMFVADGEPVVEDDNKAGFFTLTLVKEITPPTASKEVWAYFCYLLTRKLGYRVHTALEYYLNGKRKRLPTIWGAGCYNGAIQNILRGCDPIEEAAYLTLGVAGINFGELIDVALSRRY